MRVPFYDITAQYTELKSDIDRAVLEVLAAGRYVMGPNHDALEQEIAQLHRCKHGIAVNSGTDALRILLRAAGVQPGDEVITTAFTFVASVETILQVGAIPVFVDIEPDAFQMDPSKLEAAITPKTRAIMPIHLFGQLAEVEEIGEIAADHNLTVIEDAAQAIGSHHDGTYAGNFGAGAGFSFYVTKNLGAAGDGGLILTNDDEVAELCKSFRVHGMSRRRYYYDHLGYTSRLSELQAAILRVKLARLDAWNRRRGELASIYLDVLRDSPVSLPITLDGNNHTWHQFSIRAANRDDLQQALKERGVDSMIYYPVPIHFHDPYTELGAGKGSLPVTEKVCEEILSLPIHQHLTEDAVEFVAASVKELASKTVLV